MGATRISITPLWERMRTLAPRHKDAPELMAHAFELEQAAGASACDPRDRTAGARFARAWANAKRVYEHAGGKL